MLCQGCGADLDVSDDVRFVKCDYCSAKLEVVRDESTVHTRVLETIADDVKVIRLQNELEQLDREWEAERESFMVSDQEGRRKIPTKGGSAVGGIFIVIFGIVWIVFAASIGSGFGIVGSVLPIFGVVVVIAGAMSAMGSFSKAERYTGAEAKFQTQRTSILRQLEKAKSAHPPAS